MTPHLTEELRQALAQQPGQPIQVEDPVTHMRYVLVQLDDFQRLQQALDYDATYPDPRDFYPAFAKAVQDELNAPGLDRHDEDAPPRESP